MRFSSNTVRIVAGLLMCSQAANAIAVPADPPSTDVETSDVGPRKERPIKNDIHNNDAWANCHVREEFAKRRVIIYGKGWGTKNNNTDIDSNTWRQMYGCTHSYIYEDHFEKLVDSGKEYVDTSYGNHRGEFFVPDFQLSFIALIGSMRSGCPGRAIQSSGGPQIHCGYLPEHKKPDCLDNHIDGPDACDPWKGGD